MGHDGNKFAKPIKGSLNSDFKKPFVEAYFYVAQHKNCRDEKCDCVTQYFDHYNVTG